MASESDSHQLHIAVIGGDPAVWQSLVSHSSDIDQETNQETHPDNSYDHVHLMDISELGNNDSEQKGTNSLRTDIQSALDAKTERTVVGDNDSAKSGLDSTDDMPNTTKLDIDIISTRERHLKSLAEMCKQIERTSRHQHMEIESIFRGEIDSLEKTIKGGEEERHELVRLLHQRDAEIDVLRGEMMQVNESHKRQLEEHKKREQEELSRAEEHRRQEQEELSRAEEHRRQEQQERSRAEERFKQESQDALAALRVEMTAASEKRVSDLLEETGREAEERVNKVRAEMTRMKADFEKEREQTMKEMRSEMVRLADREREARERSRRAELAQKSDEYRQSLQTWAVARLWGVGQTRAR